ncbi:MAG: MBOAT family protein [Treponema sp.]|nr:MBOAT family protein [Treponema sp.]
MPLIRIVNNELGKKMSFISITFGLFVFSIFVLYYAASLLRNRSAFVQQVILFIGSFVFYGFTDIRFIPFLLYIIIIAWASFFLCRNTFSFAIAIILEVLPLLFCKYSPTHLIFPLGLSFFTFQGISYTVDVYTKRFVPPRTTALGSLFDVALFIAFFPTISSGPIQRPAGLIPQFHQTHRFVYDSSVEGIILFAWGLLKKMFIADRIAIYVNYVYGSLSEQYGCALLLTAVLYSFQIYCDFSGYSDMAIGVSKVFGFELGKNFNHPYLAQSVGDFWRRWHISLSSWLRDYVYIPLGGSRVILPRIYINLMLTFLVSGIWHGSSWSFVVWGLLHGVYQCMGRATKSIQEKLRLPSVLKIFITFCLITVAWIFFRADTLQDALFIIRKIVLIPSELIHFTDLKATLGSTNAIRDMFSLFDPACGGFKGMAKILLLSGALWLIEMITAKRDGVQLFRSQKLIIRWILYLVFVLFLVYGTSDDYSGNFIYQNF